MADTPTLPTLAGSAHRGAKILAFRGPTPMPIPLPIGEPRGVRVAFPVPAVVAVAPPVPTPEEAAPRSDHWVLGQLMGELGELPAPRLRLILQIAQTAAALPPRLLEILAGSAEVAREMAAERPHLTLVTGSPS